MNQVKPEKRKELIAELKKKFLDYDFGVEMTSAYTTSPVESSHSRITNRMLYVKGTPINLKDRVH